MHNYLAHGLQLRSTLPLPELIAGGAGCDVAIHRVGGPSRPPGAEDDRTYLRIGAEETLFAPGRGATFTIRGGRRIAVAMPEDGDWASARLFLLGGAMALMLCQRGRVVLHASAVAVDGGAVAFLGRCGWGKSTLAAALHRCGHRLLADDVLSVALPAPGAAAHAFPAFPQLKLTAASASALGRGAEELVALHPREEKRGLRALERFDPHSVPLRKLYVLEPSDRVASERLGAQETLVELVRHSYPTRFGYPGDGGHLERLACLARTVPVDRLERGTLSRLEDLVRLVEGALRPPAVVRAADGLRRTA